jgi:voltage-gated potassium channel
MLGLVLLGGSLGYWSLGASPLDAVYRAVTVITTVGFQQSSARTRSEKVFTIVLVLLGVGTALYALGALLEVLVDGQLGATFGRKRMERKIAAMSGHVIICGWGRVGRVVADQLARQKVDFVVVDIDADRVAGIEYPSLVGDATDDAVLREAGIEHAKALVTVMSNDAADLYVTLSGRSLNPGLFIVGRARGVDCEEKILRARRRQGHQPAGHRRVADRRAVATAARGRSSSTSSRGRRAWSSGSRSCALARARRCAVPGSATLTCGCARVPWCLPFVSPMARS